MICSNLAGGHEIFYLEILKLNKKRKFENQYPVLWWGSLLLSSGHKNQTEKKEVADCKAYKFSGELMHEDIVFRNYTFLKITERSGVQLSHLFHGHQPRSRDLSYQNRLILADSHTSYHIKGCVFKVFNTTHIL